jgi:zinc/manganese transport system permease protein
VTAHLALAYQALAYQPNWWPILTSSFMSNALIGGTIVALAAGLIGYFVVVRHTAFAAHALAHIGFPGATGAVLLGVPVPVGLGVFCVGGALVIGVLGKRAAEREVVTGTVLAMATALGLFFNSLATKSSSTVTNVLFGNLLAISHGQLLSFAILLMVLGLSVGIIYRPLLFTSVNALVAEAKGVPVRALSMIFMALLGLTVTMAVQAVGTLLLFALVVAPAATAILLTPRPVMAMVASTAISLTAVWLGLGASAMFNLPPSFPIVTIACVVWATVWLINRGGRVAAQPSSPAGQAHDGARHAHAFPLGRRRSSCRTIATSRRGRHLAPLRSVLRSADDLRVRGTRNVRFSGVRWCPHRRRPPGRPAVACRGVSARRRADPPVMGPGGRRRRRTWVAGRHHRLARPRRIRLVERRRLSGRHLRR